MGGVAANRVTVDGSGINGSGVGLSGGVQSVVLTEQQMPKHNHGGSVSAGGKHTHNITLNNRRGADGNVGNSSGWDAGDVYLGSGFSKQTNEIADHTHSIPDSGNSQPHTNMQPSLIINKIIRVR